MAHSKQLYIKEVLTSVPHLLEMLDRSPVSRTYGCFDREYWHYKAKDFPSGMHEEGVITLALLYTNNFEGNIYFNTPRIKEYVIAGINFAITHSHSNGSNDDYYPNEEALGSTSFSLYACTEAYLALDLKDDRMENFFKKRGDFIAKKKESGTLSNHHALVGVALHNVFLITKDEQFKKYAEQKIAETLSYQSPEGWFKEYEGCDPGYLTFTIDFLAKYLQKNPDNTELKNALEKAIHFCFLTIHPDGSYGGEYGSRNTHHALPNGFEILSKYFTEAIFVRNRFLESLENKTNSRIDDDRIFHLYTYNHIQAFLNHDESLESQTRNNNYEELFKDAGLLVHNKNGLFVICSINKGGVFKAYRGKELITSDCGVLLSKELGQKITSQVWSKLEYSKLDDALTIKSSLYNYSQILPSPFKQLVFRILTIGLGLKFSKIIRIILQKILITSKQPTSTKLERVISFKQDRVEITDKIKTPDKDFKNIYIPSDFTGIYVASSQPYSLSTLLPWENYSQQVETLNKTGELTIKRSF